MKKVLVTGSAGLIGSEATIFFSQKGFKVIGIDNDMRAYFFGKGASTEALTTSLQQTIPMYEHHNIDIRDQAALASVFRTNKFDIIIHTAAQPSHDWAAREPLTDFGINALGTMVLLECFRIFCPEASFIFTSTNKVYGDHPNALTFEEHESRFELPREHKYYDGIDEGMSIDQATHSIFGASKVAADIMVQEYGRYFGLNTVVFRGGCLTGPNHAGAEMHGFLSYLAKCISKGLPYTVYGHKGKQVRDNIHSRDLIEMFWVFHNAPRCGEVYNAGGGRYSNISMLEAIKFMENLFGRKASYNIVAEARKGDHIWYVSSLKKFREHYPSWVQHYNIESVIKSVCSKHA